MAPARVKTWDDYRAEVREFDAVLEYAKAVLSSLVGKRTPSASASYAQQIFVKVLGHCIVLRRLSPDPSQKAQSEFWDVSSVSAIARCAIEAHDSFMYIAATSATADERELRLLLWEAHDKTRRLYMLEAIGSSHPQKEKIRADAQRLLALVKEHRLFRTLRTDLQKKVLKGDPPAFNISQRDLCRECDVDYDYYTAVTVQLSQHIHTFPFSVRQLFEFKAGTLDALRLMALPLQFALPFLSRATGGMRVLFPKQTPEPPSRTARSMVLWQAVSSKGTKTAT
jgi:hypothetical protein